MSCTRSPTSRCTRSNAGISVTHGTHHEAKKFTTIGVEPSRSPSLVSAPPSREARVTSAADAGRSPAGLIRYVSMPDPLPDPRSPAPDPSSSSDATSTPETRANRVAMTYARSGRRRVATGYDGTVGPEAHGNRPRQSPRGPVWDRPALGGA